MSAQIHEYLRLDGKPCRIACELDLPDSAPGLVYLTGKKYIKPCSGCWRGYIGYWEIKDSRLFLRKIIGNVRGRFRPPHFAEWYSGTIRVPQGKMLRYFHDEFSSVYERDVFIEISAGVVMGCRVVEHCHDNPSENPA